MSNWTFTPADWRAWVADNSWARLATPQQRYDALMATLAVAERGRMRKLGKLRKRDLEADGLMWGTEDAA